MKKKDRPFEYFLDEMYEYVNSLRCEYQLKELRGEPYSATFYLGQIDAINYIVRVGARIFKRTLAGEAPTVRALSDEECEAIVQEQKAYYKIHGKKGAL